MHNDYRDSFAVGSKIRTQGGTEGEVIDVTEKVSGTAISQHASYKTDRSRVWFKTSKGTMTWAAATTVAVVAKPTTRAAGQPLLKMKHGDYRDIFKPGTRVRDTKRKIEGTVAEVNHDAGTAGAPISSRKTYKEHPNRVWIHWDKDKGKSGAAWQLPKHLVSIAGVGSKATRKVNEPDCKCDIKSLLGISGHDQNCAYYKWKHKIS